MEHPEEVFTRILHTRAVGRFARLVELLIELVAQRGGLEVPQLVKFIVEVPQLAALLNVDAPHAGGRIAGVGQGGGSGEGPGRG